MQDEGVRHGAQGGLHVLCGPVGLAGSQTHTRIPPSPLYSNRDYIKQHINKAFKEEPVYGEPLHSLLSPIVSNLVAVSL